MVAQALSVLSLVLFFPVVAFAQASLPATLPVDLAVDDALGQLVLSFGGLRGATALGIAVFVVQALLFFFRTKLAEFAGKWRLLVVAGLNLVFVLLALLAAGVPFLASLTHTSTALAFQVLLNQVFKQVKKEA